MRKIDIIHQSMMGFIKKTGRKPTTALMTPIFYDELKEEAGYNISIFESSTFTVFGLRVLRTPDLSQNEIEVF